MVIGIVCLLAYDILDTLLGWRATLRIKGEKIFGRFSRDGDGELGEVFEVDICKRRDAWCRTKSQDLGCAF